MQKGGEGSLYFKLIVLIVIFCLMECNHFLQAVSLIALDEIGAVACLEPGKIAG